MRTWITENRSTFGVDNKQLNCSPTSKKGGSDVSTGSWGNRKHWIECEICGVTILDYEAKVVVLGDNTSDISGARWACDSCYDEWKR